ncbi:unnamed protein product, partial [Symbiodinium sp. CCMP2456]
MVTEINRLTEMKALTRRPLQELESEERVERQEEEDSSQGTKWLTTKFVLRFRNKRWNSILVVHVDDIQAAGKSTSVEPKLRKLGETYELKVEGPFLTEQEPDNRQPLDQEEAASFRTQKSVSLGSGEAEYYAGASAASDSILLQEAIKFLTMRTCKDLHKEGTISVRPVGQEQFLNMSACAVGTVMSRHKAIRNGTFERIFVFRSATDKGKVIDDIYVNTAEENFAEKDMVYELNKDFEHYGENENEYYTQSYTGPEKEDDNPRRNKEKAKEKEKEMEGFEYPRDYGQEWKYFTEGGQIYKMHYVTQEKIWVDYDYTYKHEKGRGKEKKEGKGKRNQKEKATPGFVPRDEEGKQYWEEMDRQIKEKEQMKEQEAAQKKEKEERIEAERKRMEEAPATAEEKEAEEAAAAEKEAEEAAKAAKEAKEQEKKRKEKEARKKREQQQKEAAAYVARKKEENEAEEAAAAEEKEAEEAAPAEEEDTRIKKLEEMMERLLEERKEDKSRIAHLQQELESRGSQAPAEEREEEEVQGKDAGEQQHTGEQDEKEQFEEEKDTEEDEIGPSDPKSYRKGAGRNSQEGSYFAIYSFENVNYQWKWVEKNKYWYYWDMSTKKWIRQAKDNKGKEKSLKQQKDHEEWLEGQKQKQQDQEELLKGQKQQKEEASSSSK